MSENEKHGTKVRKARQKTRPTRTIQYTVCKSTECRPYFVREIANWVEQYLTFSSKVWPLGERSRSYPTKRPSPSTSVSSPHKRTNGAAGWSPHSGMHAGHSSGTTGITAGLHPTHVEEIVARIHHLLHEGNFVPKATERFTHSRFKFLENSITSEDLHFLRGLVYNIT